MRSKFNIIFNTYCFGNQNCKTSHPLPSVIKAKHKLCLSQMRCRPLIYDASPLKDWDAGIAADENIWFGWFGRQKSWQKSLKASADAAIAQTPKWWHNCCCRFDTTCFPVMTAMPLPERLVAKQNPSLIPTDTHTGA